MQYFTLILGFLLSILSAQFLKLRTSNHILKTALHTSLSSVSSNTVNYTPPGTPSNATNMSAAFLSTIAARRSMYQLANRSPITDRQIRDIVTKSLDYVPSAFNSQTTRMVLLLHDDHRKLWQIVLETLKEMGTMKDTTKDRIQGMENAYGTILFCMSFFPLLCRITFYVFLSRLVPDLRLSRLAILLLSLVLLRDYIPM